MDTNLKKEIETQIIIVAENIVQSKINPIQGCRDIVTLKNALDINENSIFDTFVAISSETEIYPIEERHRKNFNDSYLKELDITLTDYISSARPEIVEACKKLILLLKNNE